MKDSDILDTWRSWVLADAERRGLHTLKPLVAGFAVSAGRLRQAAWNADAASGTAKREEHDE